jgi:hypothetical protein
MAKGTLLNLERVGGVRLEPSLIAELLALDP